MSNRLRCSIVLLAMTTIACSGTIGGGVEGAGSPAPSSPPEAAGSRASAPLSNEAAAGGATDASTEGSTSSGSSFVRTGPAGSLDTSFAGVGYVVRSRTAGAKHGRDSASAVAVDAGGRIVVAGQSQDAAGHTNAAAWRLLDTGAFDASFGTQGAWTRTATAGEPWDRAFSMCLDTQGHVVLAGTSTVDMLTTLAVWRLTPAGADDATFGVAGAVTKMGTAAPGASDFASAVACAPSGGVVVTGRALGMTAWRFTDSGALDTSFAAPSGFVVSEPDPNTPPSSPAVSGDAVTVDRASRLVIAGVRSDAAGDAHGAVWRVGADGLFDATFAGAGLMTVDAALQLNAVAVDRAGRIVAAGASRTRAVVVRLDEHGALDASFGVGGVVALAPESGQADRSSASAIAVDGHGRLLVAGLSRLGIASAKLAVWRLEDSGALDASFASGGLFTNGLTGGESLYAGSPAFDDAATGIAVDADDRPVVVGRTYLPQSELAMAVWRLNP